MFKQWLNDESGQAMSEYGLLIALVAVVAVGVVTVFGTKIKGAFQSACTALNGGTAC